MTEALEDVKRARLEAPPSERRNAPVGPAPQRWLVVICREGVTEALPFSEEEDACIFFERASAQWSDSYLARIVSGPRDLCGDLSAPAAPPDGAMGVRG